MLRLLTLLLTCLLCTKTVAQVFERHAYTIPAQPVSNALLELALQRNLNLVYLADMTQDLTSSSLEGEYTLPEALDIMLQGSGLRASISNGRMIKIELLPPVPKPKVANLPLPAAKPAIPVPQEKQEKVDDPPPMEEILVVAQFISPYNLGTTVSSTKTQRDFLTTPQVVNALPESLSRDVAARDYSQATQLASSVNFLERSAGVAEELRLRGFAYPALKINGVGAHAYIAPVDVAFIDNIEIAKGPSSVLFGRMEPGGIINMMLKKPEGATSNLNIRGASDDFRRLELDLSYAFNYDTEIRAIGFQQKHGDASTLDLDDAQGVMLALSHHFDSGTQFNGHYRYENIDVLQQFGSPVEGFDNSVDVYITDEEDVEFIPSRQSDLRSGLKESRHSLYLSLTDWLVGDWSGNAYLQYDQFKADSQLNYPVIENFTLEIDGQTVNDSELTVALLENDTFLQQVLEGLESIVIDENNLFFENQPFNFNTHFVSTELTLYNSAHIGEVELEQLYGFNLNYSEPETLIWQTHDLRGNFVPVEQAEVVFNSEEVSSNVKDINAGVFGQWALSWRDITAFVGLRLDHLAFRADKAGIASNGNFWEPTFRFGAVYQIATQSSVFFNYSESFSPQFDAVDVLLPPANQGVNQPVSPAPETDEPTLEDSVDEEQETAPTTNVIGFPAPARAHQWEVGFKQTWYQGRLQTGCALFRIEKRGIFSAIREQRSQGLECDAAGSIGENWQLTLGLSLLNAEIRNSDLEEFQNKRPRMTPRENVRLWLTRELPLFEHWQTRVGLGYNHIGERYIDPENDELLPAYNIVDVGLFANYRRKIDISLLLRNAFDTQFVEGAFNAIPAWTTQGIERTLETRFIYRF